MTTRLRIALVLVLIMAPGLSLRAQDTEPAGQVWGYIFGDYFYKAVGDTARWGGAQYAGEQEGMNAGELRRLYLGYDYQFTPNISSRVLFEANNGTLFAGGSYGVLIKLGYLSWKEPAGVPLTFNVGLIPTPVFTFPEKAWGYRSIEKEALDARGLGSSADQGISVEGALGENAGFRVMAANNSGTKSTTDPHKALYGSVFNRFLERRLSLEVMGSYLPKRGEQSRSIGRLFAGYEAGFATFGLEVAGIYETAPADWGRIPGTEVTRLLVSGFASFPIYSGSTGVGGFVRYDFFDPDLDFAANKSYVLEEPFYTQHLFILGIDIAPTPRVHVMPNLWMNLYRARGDAASRDPDIVPRLTFYFIY